MLPCAAARVSREMSEEAQAGPAPRREASDFSIERILAKDASSSSGAAVKGSACSAARQTSTSFLGRDLARSSASFSVRNKLDWLRNFCDVRSTDVRIVADKSKTDTVINSTESIAQKDKPNLEHFNGEELSWLRCTRYCPPKLPRKSSAGKSLKRKPGSHPRIPFTKHQLEILEDKYKNSAYLARKDVVSLSDLLHLPQTRIKIWFQNRRARARRESQSLDQTHATRI